ncbi:MAG: galactose mutarotase [Bacteroidales bacterium]|nr:galactose mutarotase [Bacteroidales bacterium]
MKKIFVLIAAMAALVGCGGPRITKSGIDPSDFKTEYNGKKVALYTLTNKAGIEVCITNFGGRIVSLMAPDADGNFRDIVLGFKTAKEYFPENNQTDFGACIGRYANRIDHGHLEIDGVTYQLPGNNFGHCLHGGPTGWQYQVYDAVEVTPNRLKLTILSPDGDNGFPGNVTASVTYTLTEDNKIEIAYEAVTDKATVINMTNHSYFNLAGESRLERCSQDFLRLNASRFTPIDDTYMTTGEIRSVAGTPFDFRRGEYIGKGINDTTDVQIVNGNGYDHNWLLDTGRKMEIAAAELYSPDSGILLTVYTDEPGIQIYSGNFLDGTVVGKSGLPYRQRTGICLETQKYPDTPNKPDWPSALLRPGETYQSHTTFAFTAIKL